jgi:hypothetical protein
MTFDPRFVRAIFEPLIRAQMLVLQPVERGSRRRGRPPANCNMTGSLPEVQLLLGSYRHRVLVFWKAQSNPVSFTPTDFLPLLRRLRCSSSELEV